MKRYFEILAEIEELETELVESHTLNEALDINEDLQLLYDELKCINQLSYEK